MSHSKIPTLALLATLMACGSADHTLKNESDKSLLGKSSLKAAPATKEKKAPLLDTTGDTKVMDLDAAVESKLFLNSDRNVLIIADFQNTAKPEKLLKTLDQLQAELLESKVKIYRVDIASKSAVAKALVAKHSKNPDNSSRKLPVAVLANDPAKMVSRMEGQSDFNVLEQFIVSNFKTDKPASASEEDHTPADKAIMFTSPTCGICNDMKPLVEKLKAEGMPIEIHSTDSHPGEYEDYEISLFPTFIFFDANGKELSRHVGSASEQDLKARIKK